MSELLPCPCCASEVSSKAAFANGYGTYYSIQCACGISINHPSEAELIARWNRRESAANRPLHT